MMQETKIREEKARLLREVAFCDEALKARGQVKRMEKEIARLRKSLRAEQVRLTPLPLRISHPMCACGPNAVIKNVYVGERPSEVLNAKSDATSLDALRKAMNEMNKSTFFKNEMNKSTFFKTEENLDVDSNLYRDRILARVPGHPEEDDGRPHD